MCHLHLHIMDIYEVNRDYVCMCVHVWLPSPSICISFIIFGSSVQTNFEDPNKVRRPLPPTVFTVPLLGISTDNKFSYGHQQQKHCAPWGCVCVTWGVCDGGVASKQLSQPHINQCTHTHPPTSKSSHTLYRRVQNTQRWIFWKDQGNRWMRSSTKQVRKRHL